MKRFIFFWLLLIFFTSESVFALSKKRLSETLKTPIVVDYWPIDKTDLKELHNFPDFVKVINLAFAFPDGKGGLRFSGKNNVSSPEDIKKITDFFQKKNKLVLLSIAGVESMDNTPWNLDTVDLNHFCENIKKIVEKYHFNGIDIDYEFSKHREILPLFIRKLRSLLPPDKYLVTYAGFSTGAYGIEGHEHLEWDKYSSKGFDVAILKEIRDEIDWVSVMAYNAFSPDVEPPYNPEHALLAFQNLMGGKSKVLLGILLGKQDYPKDLIVTSQKVRPWIEFVKKENFRGVMFFQLSNDIHNITGEPNATFIRMTREILFEH